MMSASVKTNEFLDQLAKQGVDVYALTSDNKGFRNPILSYYWRRSCTTMEHGRDIGFLGTEEYRSTLPQE